MLVNTNEEQIKQKIKQIRLGGGQKRIDKHHEKGKLTARERIDYYSYAVKDKYYLLQVNSICETRA